MIDFEKLIREKTKLSKKYPEFVVNGIIATIKSLFHEDEINKFWQNHANEKNEKFIDSIFKYLNFDYEIGGETLDNIPQTGRVIFVSNHPLGALDGLSIIKLINSIRGDAKILANSYLNELEPLKDLFIGIDNLGGKNPKEVMKFIENHLQDEKAIIVFPAGEVSRAGLGGVIDSEWKDGFLKFAKKTMCPIVPIYVDAKNSFLFYLTSFINKPLSGLLLGHELFNKRNKKIKIKIGEMIPYENLNLGDLNRKSIVNLVKKHIYKIGHNEKGVFKTIKCLAKPQDKKLIADEITSGEKIGVTRDGKGIYVCETPKHSPLLLELGRLRELSFRQVGEGTGESMDIDEFDLYYKHLVLFDEANTEIIGAYRIGDTSFIKPSINEPKIYTQTLFDFRGGSEFLFDNSVELGRSFVVPKFWGSRALDYLWYGIGAYAVKYPNVKYLFGPVSISASYPKPARNLLIYFYKKYFGGKENIIVSNNSYHFSADEKAGLDSIFCGENYEQNFEILKNNLAFYGLFVPTLYKQYSDLCDDGGVSFYDFGTDPDFCDCVDGFLVVDIAKIKPEKKKRYFKGL